ncbi:MAG: two-component regulator propeller domain-containing protein [Ferruginibacter sp.]
MIKIATILLFLLLTVNGLYSQDFQARYLGIEKGLSNNTVTSVFQDHKGFMWFGTYDGLNRYDGYECSVFRNVIGDSNSIFSNNINCINEDGLHNIWVGGQKEISVYHPLTSYFSTPTYTFFDKSTRSRLSDNVISLLLIQNNTMLAGTQHNGLFYFDNSTSNGKQVPIVSKNKILTTYYVAAIKYNPVDSAIYVLIQNEGVFKYDQLKHTISKKYEIAHPANCLQVSHEGTIWIGDNSGLYRLNSPGAENSIKIIPSNTPVVGLCEDKKGNLWIATDGRSVWMLPTGQSRAVPLSSVSPENKLLINSNAVYTIYEDRQERKWIGTLRGGVNILEIQRVPFKTITYQSADRNTAVENFIFSFCEDKNHNIWIGTDGAGLRYWNRQMNRFENFTHDDTNLNSISDNFITSIIQDGTDGLWISTWFGGINHYDISTKQFRHFTCFNPVTNLPNNNVWALMQDRHMRLWASAVRNGGLYLFNANADKFEMFDSHLTDLQCLAGDADGNIWGGDYTSLIKIDTLNKKHTFYNIGYAIRSIYQDRKRNFWIGTQEGGLLLFNRADGTFKRFTTTNGLPHNTILRILEDKSGNLWLSTYNGLSKFDVEKKTFTNFSQSDGLQSNQFSFNAALALDNGELLFGGIRGFNIFYPETVSKEKNITPLFLSGLKINNIPIEHNLTYVKQANLETIKKVVVPFDDATFSFDFLGLDYSNASTLNYAYYLQGWDKDWNQVRNTRSASYTRLHEGNYTFSVKVNNAGGDWGRPQELLYITVLPPWYRTWWAYGLYIILGGAAVYLYVLYIDKQDKLRFEVRLAHLEIKQEKELNEKKIAFFTNVSHEFRAPLSLIINPIKDFLRKSDRSSENAELHFVHRNAQRLLRLVDQLLLFKQADAGDKLNLIELSLVNLCKDVFDCFTEQARLNNISYKFISNMPDVIIKGDREKLEIALFNILSNAFKYTPNGGEISFETSVENEYVNITILDTGSGIAAHEGEKLFERFYQVKGNQSKSGFGIGLYLVKKFIEAHDGKVSYQSTEGKGTSFTILLNKGIDNSYYSSEGKKKADPSITKNVPLLQRNNNMEMNIEPDMAGRSHSTGVSLILNELKEEVPGQPNEPGANSSKELIIDKQTLLIIDDDDEMLTYLMNIFSGNYKVYRSDSAGEGIKLAHKYLPDLIISDIVMKGLNGLDLCRTLKEDETVSHIPVILLTGSSSDEVQLQSMQSGADDYINKPFDKDILIARVDTLLKRRNILQNYFLNEVTLGTGKFKVSAEYREFLEKCMAVIENHLNDDQFSVKVLSTEMGMSHSNLYKKVKAVSGQTLTGFIRYIRLKNAAEILINTESNVNETAGAVGFNDTKYFRIQFSNLFGLTPSDYIKKYRKPFHNTHNLEDDLRK